MIDVYVLTSIPSDEEWLRDLDTDDMLNAVEGVFPTEEAAKAHAQADYTERYNDNNEDSLDLEPATPLEWERYVHDAGHVTHETEGMSMFYRIRKYTI